MNRKVIAILGGVAALSVLGSACSSSGQNNASSQANNAEQSQQGADSRNLEYAIPIPQFPFSQIRQDLVEVEAIQALGVATTTFGFEYGSRDPAWSCPSIGLPIAVTDQLSNPTQILADPNNQYNNNGSPGSVLVPQEDPNGIYSGPSTGTNVICVAKNGSQYDHYEEGFVSSVTAQAYWDFTTHQMVVVGAPEIPKCTVVVESKTKAKEVCVK